MVVAWVVTDVEVDWNSSGGWASKGKADGGKQVNKDAVRDNSSVKVTIQQRSNNG